MAECPQTLVDRDQSSSFSVLLDLRSMEDSPQIDVHALFLGPKSENRKFFKEMLNFVMDEHIHWRRDFHPSDSPWVSLLEQRQDDYQSTLMQTEEALMELSSRLKAGSVPAFSPRYQGHMISDTLLAANLGYLAAILYNPNNCSYEVSPASTELEIEVGKQMARLFGFEESKSWGHITSGGTVANYEALWVARNLKSMAQTIVKAYPEMVGDKSTCQSANLPVDEALDLMSHLKENQALAILRKKTVQYRGASAGLGKVLVPASKHYSWVKAVDILGLGQNCLVSVPVTPDFRMDISALRGIVTDLVEEETPILAVVAVLGTTEVGAVDELHRITEFQNELRASHGVGFYLHVDAAYGGYARAAFLNEESQYLELEELRGSLVSSGALSEGVEWPSPEVHAAYRATSFADSVTVDPHKLGYIPYAAGGVVMKDRRVLDLISYFAAYVFEESEVSPNLLGSFIMEGSKPGASAASVWMAHRVLSLDVHGYGKLLGQSVEGAHNFYQAIVAQRELEVMGVRYVIEPLVRPDLNLVDFCLNRVGNESLEVMNDINEYLYDCCSYRSGPVYLEDFILSKTVLKKRIYDSAPTEILGRLGIPESDWEMEGRVFVLRSCMMTPNLSQPERFESHCNRFWKALSKHLAQYQLESRAQSMLPSFVSY